jgi:TonB family protein
MIKLRVLWLLAGMTLVQVGWGQSDVHALEKALKGQQMALRSYSADPVASYTWVGDKLEAEPVKMHTLGVFTARSVKQQKDKIIFDGERATIIRDVKKNQVGLAGKTPMKIEVDLRGTDPAVVLPRLQEMLFFSDAKSIMDGLPEQVADMIPLEINGAPTRNCHCAHIFDGSHWIRMSLPSTKYTPPKVTHVAEPNFTEEAGEQKIKGSVTLVFYVSDVGRVDEIWLAKPLEAGLDEQAAIAARKYTFNAAQVDGRPAGTMVRVVMNFQIF